MSKINGYQLLGNAIVKQAAYDYRKCLRELNLNPNDRRAKRAIRDLEDFFCNPDRIGMCTNLNGKQLMLDIRKDAEERNYSLSGIRRDEDLGE